MQNIEFSETIFRAYDIRGVVGKDWNASAAHTIGLAIGSSLKERGLKTCVIGRDGRLSGEALMAALSEGVCLAGIDVLNIGLAATPAGYFAGYHLKADAVLMVTASHNPASYNGIKIVIENRALSGEEIQAIKQRILAGQFIKHAQPGICRTVDIKSAYHDRVLHGVQIKRPIKVAIDCANAIMSVHAPDVFKALGVEVVPLYCELDGSFPNHEPDPSHEENLYDLKQVVKEEGCELGLAFDGDGDRLVVVTAEGTVIDPDRLLMFFADAVLKGQSGGKVVYDVKCTGALIPWIKARGGVPVMARSGHSFIKASMRENAACLGGEMSGHIFFADRWYGFDDGLYAAVRLLELVSLIGDEGADGGTGSSRVNVANGAKVATVLNALPKPLNTPEIHWRFESDAAAHAMMARIAAEVRFPRASHIHVIDGLRVEYPYGFGLIRASNTSPNIVLRFEGQTQVDLQAIQADFRQELLKIAGAAFTLPVFSL